MKNNILKFTACLLGILSFSSCENYLEPELSPDKIFTEDVFANETTASAALYGIYADFMLNRDPTSISNGGLSVFGGLCSDELFDFSLQYTPYNKNEVPLDDFGPVYNFWTTSYKLIYSANAILEGVEKSNLKESFKKQVMGEVYFIRAFNHFYLQQIYGNIPIINTTDYTVNAVKKQNTPEEVFAFVLEDLKKAASLLTDTYPTADKLRPNRHVVQALLARVYLYHKDWANARDNATAVINGGYEIQSDLTQVFAKNSSETIWELMPSNLISTSVGEATWFTPGGQPNYTLTDAFFSTIESGDKRRQQWVGNIDYLGTTYYFPNKYDPAGGQYSVIFRLSEQYLIRAEAHAELNNLTAAKSDLNKIRVLHGDLGEYSGPDTKNDIVDAILQERKAEYFGEWGHRWFDLKRTGKIDAVLGALKPTTWKSTDVLWPIDAKELKLNPFLKQNDGY
ncbi:RagB/SusD family nutrient uptake outer membrane protein [Flavobacterium pectinovorum]|uniref:RagB/SusD family nutrient uptake outer membrane protein n=1 Tax=Flavobacterium pectinovorum TaxID=29533 RepID=UPI001FAE0C7E|nr:RagB/SusD family nutrient uptake outer membrane protein [Flavobacterium pectinovorum]MCI9844601.1 RagB/SusD family nutrient uptake outer membrane protein [Flavobacterium pectinovorum]